MKFFSLIFQGEIHPAAEEKVIPAESYSQILEAYEIIEKAKEDAKALHDKTKKECAGLKEKAKQQGMEEGLEQFNVQILKMDQELKKLRHDLQRMVLPIALKAAKKIVGKELAIFPETIVDIVLQALEPISQSHKVTIFVNKQDKEMLESQKPKILERLAQIETLSIQEKSGVAPGGCIIQTESGMINATIENQWASLEKAFEQYFKPK
ncbi:MAG TPA: HrpE/YscL family type III secretion apparatus protein [Rhabdochlamydiaceae bacterium]|nr:HrpE/YscL family type III secretion apparatus protein [Rhabdochlamydiaceae bacterium]